MKTATYTRSDLQLIKSNLPSGIVEAFRRGLASDAMLEHAIGFAVCMILQCRQSVSSETVPVDFDICDARLAVFREIAGRDARDN